MYRKNILTVILLMFFVNACAGIGVFSSAQNEFSLGVGLFSRGQYEEAIMRFNRSTELDPKFTKSYIYLGRSYLNLWRWPEAIPPLRSALSLSPEETKHEIGHMLIEALMGAAASDFTKGNFQNSINYLRDALQLEPNSGKLVNELVNLLIVNGKDLLSRGRSSEAIHSFNEAIQLSPDNVEAYLGLAKASFQKGDISMALAAAGKALQIDPSNMKAQSLMNQWIK